MPDTKLKRCWLAILVLLTVALCVSCVHERPQVKRKPVHSDEDDILAVLDVVEQGVESRNLAKVWPYVSQRYGDEEGRTLSSLHRYLENMIAEYEVIEITREAPVVTIGKQMARVQEVFHTKAWRAGQRKNRPDLQVSGTNNIVLEKGDGIWRITSWAPVEWTER